MPRSPHEVLEDHLRTSTEGTVEDDIERNYASTVVILSSDGVRRGHDGLREQADKLQNDLPNCSFHYGTRLVEGEVGFLEWTATVPLSGVVTLPPRATVREAEALCVPTGFSRFPVTAAEGTFQVYVHPKDLLAVPAADLDQAIWNRWIRPLITLQADATLDDALAAMQGHGAHVAAVVGSSGLQGVAMLEDVVESIVGGVSEAEV